jgi:Ni/Fe-hydrogenase b-type cytochrome subunit
MGAPTLPASASGPRSRPYSFHGKLDRDGRRLKMTKVLVPRHGRITRLTHWVNVVALLVLLMSGLQIFNAHPALYWGIRSTFAEPWIAIKGGFPHWATLPGYKSLGDGRLWHFFFAWVFVLNGLLYLLAALVGGHLKRDLLPGRDQLSPRHFWHEVITHARLRFPKGEEARRYNLLQKLAYLAVIFVLLPLMLATGLTMSPGFNAVAPWMLDLFGGRQSARTIHFLCASAIVAFVAVHLFMVVASGLWNNLRSMVTGRYAIEVEGGAE